MNTANVPRKSPRKFVWKALVLCLLAAAAAGLLLLETVSAQEGPDAGYVDLVMLYGYDATKLNPRWDVHLMGAVNRAGGLAREPRPLTVESSGSAVLPRSSG